MYVLRHLSTLERIPKALQEKIFKKLFEVAELSKLTPGQAQNYRDSLKYFQDIKNSIDTAIAQGIQQGAENEKLKIAKAILKKDLTQVLSKG